MGVAHPRQRFLFNLTNTFARDINFRCHFVEGAWAAANTKMLLENFAVFLGQMLQP